MPCACAYTQVYFTPHALQQYSGMLEAVVEGGTDPNTQAFSCEVCMCACVCMHARVHSCTCVCVKRPCVLVRACKACVQCMQEMQVSRACFVLPAHACISKCTRAYETVSAPFAPM